MADVVCIALHVFGNICLTRFVRHLHTQVNDLDTCGVLGFGMPRIMLMIFKPERPAAFEGADGEGGATLLSIIQARMSLGSPPLQPPESPDSPDTGTQLTRF